MRPRGAFAFAAGGLLIGFLAIGIPLTTDGDAPALEADRPAPPARAAGGAVTLDDRALEVSAARLRAGRVRLRIKNRGTTEHDLLVVRTDRPAADLPIGLEGVRPELAGKVVYGRAQIHHSAGREATAGAHHAGHQHLKPGKAAGATLRLQPGRYVLLCPLPGHYEAGQFATIRVG